MANFNFNEVILGGRLTADPELKKTQTGTPVVSFNLAINRRYTREGEQPQADFISCVAWEKTAEFICGYFRKGSSLALTGEIRTRSWVDAQNCKRYATEVQVARAFFVDSKEDAQGGTGAATGGAYVPDAYMSPDMQNAPQAGLGAPTAPAPHFEELGKDDDLPF